MIKTSQLTKSYYRMKAIGDLMGVHARTVQRWCDDGKLPFSMLGAKSKPSRIVARQDLMDFLDKQGLLFDDKSLRHDVIYARKRLYFASPCLNEQIIALKAFASTQNPRNLQIYTDISHDLIDNNKSLLALLKDIQLGHVERVFVYHQDHLACFGYAYIKAICDFHNTKIVCLSDTPPLRKVLNKNLPSILKSCYSLLSAKCSDK